MMKQNEYGWPKETPVPLPAPVRMLTYEERRTEVHTTFKLEQATVDARLAAAEYVPAR